MTTLPNNKLISVTGALTAIAGVLLLAAIVMPNDPLGRSIGALMGASFLVGLVGTLVRETWAGHFVKSETAAPAAVAMPHVADATASEFDGDKRPAFAPIVSLTEAQVERARAERQRRTRREALREA